MALERTGHCALHRQASTHWISRPYRLCAGISGGRGCRESHPMEVGEHAQSPYEGHDKK